MDYNSKGWQRFRKMVPYKGRLYIAWGFWILAIFPVATYAAIVGAYRGAKEELVEFWELWPRGPK